MFTTQPMLLNGLLDEVDSGKMQLPEFQRGWIWDDQRIRDLLTSVVKGNPIGAVMRLNAGGNLRFQPRPIEGVTSDQKPSSLLLDGQQRITSLYQSLTYPGPVDTRDLRGKKIQRWYYIDMSIALNQSPYREECIVSVPESKILTRDFGREEVLNVSEDCLEYENHLFPTESLFDGLDWVLGYTGYWDGKTFPYGASNEFAQRFSNEVIKQFQQYMLPVIELDSALEPDSVCLVFEKVNTGGVALTVFELLTATLAAEGFNLRKDWERRSDSLNNHSKVLQGLTSDQFLQAVTLLATQDRRRKAIREGETNRRLAPGVGCARRDILSLTRSEFEEWADIAEKGFKRAAQFLTSLCIYRSYDLPYVAQLVSLAAIYAEMDDKLDRADARARLEQWYWSGVFSEDYGSTTETRMANDLQQVPGFIQSNGDATLDMLEQANFLPERLLSLRTRTSAAYKGLHALQMKSGARDWRSGNEISLTSFFDEVIDIHHIFPQAWCKKQAQEKLGVAIPPRIFDSVINKAPLSARTNRIIGGNAPSRYLSRLKLDNEHINETIKLSDIDPKCLENDDFVSVFVNRGVALMSKISDAMGRELSDGEQVFRDELTSANLEIQTDDYDDERLAETATINVHYHM